MDKSTESSGANGSNGDKSEQAATSGDASSKSSKPAQSTAGATSAQNGGDKPKADAQQSTGAKDSTGSSKAPAPAPAPEQQQASRKPGPLKKKRKVTHACVYCRRSHMTCDLERPCTRCIKRNIGHLCHDEPRDHDHKKPKTSTTTTTADSALDESETRSQPDFAARGSLDQASAAAAAAMAMRASSFDRGAAGAAASAGPSAGGGAVPLGRGSGSIQLVRPAPVAGGGQTTEGLRNSNMNQFSGFSDAWLTAQNHLQDMQHYQNSYLIAPEVSNEFNLLNEFLNSSLLDDNALLSTDQPNQSENSMLPGGYNLGQNNGLLPQSALSGDSGMPQQQPHLQQRQQQRSVPPPSRGNADEGVAAIQRPSTANPEETRRAAADFLLQVADPSGNDTPEERMERVLRAKYEAGLLKPFNYIQGYKRLQDYLETHIAAASKQKILTQINNFRPKFREKVRNLSDYQLVFVEMWFEKTLMEYDRVFASMAVPACCWRRTGEIFRGNKEMAELIGVEVEKLRDGTIALHQILTETSMVRYWEEFGTIAFDPAHDTLLTACELKNPSDGVKSRRIKCCFSVKIRRDDYKIPSLIVGNFLPHDPSH